MCIKHQAPPAKILRAKAHRSAHCQNKRAERYLLADRVTGAQVKDLFERAHYRCERCGCTDFKKLSVDHVKPMKFGGRNKVRNMQVLCVKCNVEKGVNDTDYRKPNREFNTPFLVWTAQVFQSRSK